MIVGVIVSSLSDYTISAKRFPVNRQSERKSNNLLEATNDPQTAHLSLKSLFNFMKVIQCVFCCLPDLWPYSGRSGVSARMRDTGISSAHHLKTSVPEENGG